MPRPVVPVLICALLLAGCGQPPVTHAAGDPAWSTAFWLWNDPRLESNAPLPDALFVHVGDIRLDTYGGKRTWRAFGQWPRNLPPARAYWLVFRLEVPGAPAVESVEAVRDAVINVGGEAVRRGWHVAGVQFDIDCPTARLRDYAAFLEAVRPQISPRYVLSITALLDWFRDGTQVAAVIKQVDEFVPQFYDLGGARRSFEAQPVAAPLEPARWAPRFSSYGKPFRLGISSFGRATVVHKAKRDWPSSYQDLTPRQLGGGADFTLSSATSPIGELLLTYTAPRRTRFAWDDFEAGDTVRFTLPTRESLLRATREARRFGALARGVVYFRWDGSFNPLALSPGEALRAAAGDSSAPVPTAVLKDAGCATTSCQDLELRGADPQFGQRALYVLTASSALDYILPASGVSLRLASPTRLEFRLPPFSATSRIRLGRVVSPSPVSISVSGPAPESRP